MSKADPEATGQAARKSKRSITIGDLLRHFGYGDLVDTVETLESAGSSADLFQDLARAEMRAATRLSVPAAGNLANTLREMARAGSKIDEIEEHLREISRSLEAQNKRTVTVADALPPAPPAVDAPRREWFEWFHDVAGMGKEPPASLMPESPKDIWFHWFHYVKDELDFAMSLRDLVSRMGLTYDRIRHLHSEYQAQYGEGNSTKIAQE